MLLWSRGEGWLLHFREVRASEDGLSVLIAMETSLRNRFSCHSSAQLSTESSDKVLSGSCISGGPGWGSPHCTRLAMPVLPTQPQLLPCTPNPAPSSSQPWGDGARLAGTLAFLSSSPCLGSALLCSPWLSL